MHFVCQVSKPPENIQSDGGLKEMKYTEKVCVYSQLYLAELTFDAMNINDAIISKRRNISKSQSQKLVNESILFLSGRRTFPGPTSIQGVFMPSMALGRRLIWGNTSQRLTCIKVGMLLGLKSA